MDMQESGTSSILTNNIFRPFKDEDGASKRLKNYQFRSSVNVDKDQVLTTSSLNIVKTILPKTLKLMMLSRGNFAFDLFL